MRLMGTLGLGLLVVTGVARAEGATAPAAATAPASAAAPPVGELKAPENVYAEPSSPASAELASRAATAEMKGDPQSSLKLADEAIRANAKDPWAYYDKGMALARVGEINGALAALLAAEHHFASYDRWGRSVAVSGAPTRWPKPDDATRPGRPSRSTCRSSAASPTRSPWLSGTAGTAARPHPRALPRPRLRSSDGSDLTEL